MVKLGSLWVSPKDTSTNGIKRASFGKQSIASFLFCISKIKMNSYVLLGVAFIACFALVCADPVSNELKEYNEKLAQARAALNQAKTFLQSDYIQNFAKILEGGVDKLNETTLNELKTIHDPAKRQEVITYAVKAYVRLVKFLDEIKNTVQ